MKNSLKIDGLAQIIAVTACVLLAATRPALAQPQFLNLGQNTWPSDISADGMTVAGGGSRWTAATGWESLSRPPGFSSWQAFSGARREFSGAISSDAQVIVGTVRNTDPATRRACRWTASGGAQELGVPAGAQWSEALGVSGDGTVIVGRAEAIGARLTSPWRWTADSGMVSLAPFDEGSADDVSDDGLTIVGSSGGYAFRWQEETELVTLQPWGHYRNSSASAVSADGSIVVGMSSEPAGNQNGTLWNEDGMPSLLARTDPIGVYAYPTAISGDGTLIGGYEPGTTGPGPLPERAILWPSPDLALDVNEYLPTLGIDLTGWHLTRVTGISADGSTIVGWGEFNGQSHGWLVQGIPEPSTAALLAIGALALCRRR